MITQPKNTFRPQMPAKGRILFACVPLDGHFNPLTGLAMYLKEQGYDVRWYTGKKYAPALERLDIPAWPMRKALDISKGELDDIFPDRLKYRSALRRLTYDVLHSFVLRMPEYYEDIRDIHTAWPFDIMICDSLFTASVLVKALLPVQVIAVGVTPLFERSRDLAPSGTGLTPARSVAGRWWHGLLRFVTDRILFREVASATNGIFEYYGLPHFTGSISNVLVRGVDLFLQSGVPGFEYQRSDLSPNIRFIGSLLPYSLQQARPFGELHRCRQYTRVVLVTQGTVEQDTGKLLAPVLEAYKHDTRTLVIVTTGGNGTAALRARYSQPHFIIEDFIDFNEVMPYADVYVTNGGYGGVMLGIRHRLPLVVAGVHEGKNEINARVGYFGLGVNLRTERPTPAQLRNAIEKVLGSDRYRANVRLLGREFAVYRPDQLCLKYVRQLEKRGRQAMLLANEENE